MQNMFFPEALRKLNPDSPEYDPNLTLLNIKANPQEASSNYMEGMNSLVDILKKNYTLTKLVLDPDYLCQMNMRAFTNALKKNHSLTSLILKNESYTNKRWYQILVRKKDIQRINGYFKRNKKMQARFPLNDCPKNLVEISTKPEYQGMLFLGAVIWSSISLFKRTGNDALDRIPLDIWLRIFNCIIPNNLRLADTAELNSCLFPMARIVIGDQFSVSYQEGDGKHKTRAADLEKAVASTPNKTKLVDLFKKQADILDGKTPYPWRERLRSKHKSNLCFWNTDPNDDYFSTVYKLANTLDVPQIPQSEAEQQRTMAGQSSMQTNPEQQQEPELQRLFGANHTQVGAAEESSSEEELRMQRARIEDTEEEMTPSSSPK